MYDVLSVNEHQSTVNPNIPVREFMYAARLYDKYLKMVRANPYSTRLIALPVPKLVVLYNGRDEKPDEQVLRLGDAFKEGIRQNLRERWKGKYAGKEGAVLLEEEACAVLAQADPDIEVRVRLVNINYGRSIGIMSTCAPLREYAWLVDRIRRNMDAGLGLAGAADKALLDMPEGFGVKGQLMEHRAEVVGMWITEYNEAETMQMFREEGRREGLSEGRREGLCEGENLFAALVRRLSALGRSEEIVRAADDPQLRERLYAEYGLKGAVQ